MQVDSKEVKIFTGNANPRLAKNIAGYLNLPLGKALATTFNNGEVRIKLEESVRGCDVFVVQPTSRPVNHSLMELLVMTDALKRASARHITAVIPYYGYARQDRKATGREPITAKLVADLITVAGADRILTMDLHSSQIQGFFDINVDHLTAMPVLVDYFSKKRIPDLCVVSPDVGRVKLSRTMAERLGASLAILVKRRPQPGEAEISEIIGQVAGKNCIMADDMIDTAGTLVNGAQALVNCGAKAIYTCATHAVLSGPAIERLKKAPIKEVLVTDTIPVPPEMMLDKIKVLTVAPMLGEAIRRIYKNVSISEMFGFYWSGT
ncbi:MAG: ribose-phosphate pyrophosphokinase [bacterium]|jgi:ribose-phosphate pyrophosphokinase|nr:ribose-phosphate pyrophosphokinase [bacterium]MDD3804941.1 ribose-phosphate pyrophosphokinase [bacterium]MDD4152830.1 ribose-phosphate pyrophosphokinase [bacterium]MDD4558313.1 ribose-phosphate pyrophosphokinase [bacterium]